MGFFSKAITKRSNPLDNPAVPLSMASFLSWAFGGKPTAAGESVSTLSAMQQSTVQTCIRILSDGLASLPLKVYRQTSKGKRLVTDRIEATLLMQSPNDEMDMYSFIFALVANMNTNGNCYIEIQRGKTGLPVALWPLDPQTTQPQRDNSGNLFYQTANIAGNGSRILKAADIVHIPLFTLNGINGLSPIAMARESIGLSIAAEKYGARYFSNNATPGGILANASLSNISDEQKQLIKQSWEQAQSGQNTHRTAVLLGDWKYTPISVSPQDSQFLEIRGFQRQDIAALFAIPPSKVGDVTKQSKASAAEENLSFVIDTLRPLAVRLEKAFLRKLFVNDPTILIEFDFSERLRGDFASTMTGIATGRQWGILSENDGRRILDMDPSDGPAAEIKWAPVNMMNSARLMDTEPTLVTADPTADPTANPADPAPALETKSLVPPAMLTMYRDAFGRLMQRDKRDLQNITNCMRAVTEAIATTLNADSKYVEDALQAMTKRADKWTDADTDAPAEYRKLLKTLHINAQKDMAAQRAIQEIEKKNDD